MSLKIAHLAKPWLAIPPQKYGAIERMIYYLVGEQKKSHQLTVFAPGSSSLSSQVTLISLFSEAQGDKGLDRNTELAQAVHAVMHAEKAGIDVLHVHSVAPFLGVAPFIHLPSVFTFYSVPTSADRILSELAGGNTFFTFLSKKHRDLFPWIKGGEVVYLGVKTEEFPFSAQHKDYLAFVGSIADRKGILEAMEISKRVGVPLKIAARVRVEDREFYQKCFLKAQRDSPGIEFMGEVSEDERNTLLKYARAMLFPIKWEEPFGYVLIESLAVGTPVIAFNRGSVPEIIADGKTGYIVENVGQAIKACGRIDSIDRFACRRSVVERFSIERSVAAYEEIYKKVLFSKSVDKRSIAEAVFSKTNG